MADQTSENPARRALQQHLRLLAERRIEEWVELFAPDGVIEYPYAPPGAPVRVQGRDALLDQMRGFAGSVAISFVDVVFHPSTDPHVAVAEFGTTGQVVSTGKPYEQRCVAIVHTDEAGRIVLFKDYWNPLVAIEAFSPDEAAVAG